MAGFYQSFVAVRTTEPDFALLLAQLRALDATAGLRRDSTTNYALKKSTAWTGPQITAAQNVLNNAVTRTEETLAQAQVDTLGIREKAILLTTIDELNRLRGQPTTTFVDITPAMAIAAVRTKAGTL